MPRSGTTAVGKEALAYCTSCKMDLNHVIVAMKGDRIAKVQCRTCKKDHVYKAPKGVTEPTTAPEKLQKAAAKAENSKADHSIQAEWQKLMVTHKNAPLKSYGAKNHFVLGDKINHPSFGHGIVSRLIYPNKIEIIFEHDLKVLIHAGGSPS